MCRPPLEDAARPRSGIATLVQHLLGGGGTAGACDEDGEGRRRLLRPVDDLTHVLVAAGGGHRALSRSDGTAVA